MMKWTGSPNSRLNARVTRRGPVELRVSTGLYLVMALEAGGSRRRSTLVAVMCGLMAGLYIAALLIPAARTFFELTAPDAGMIATAFTGKRRVDRRARAVRIFGARGVGQGDR